MSRKGSVSSETMYSAFATNLRDLLQKRGMNQSQLAAATSLQRQTISNYVLGQSVPDGDILIKLSDSLDVSVDYLLGRSHTESIDSSIQGAVNCTGLKEEAITQLISLNNEQKEIASLIISSPEFKGFLNAFFEAIEISGQAWAKLEAFSKGLDENASVNALDYAGQIFEETFWEDRELQGFKYGVIQSTIKMLNDIQPYDEIIERFSTLHTQFDISSINERIVKLQAKEEQKNGLDKT